MTAKLKEPEIIMPLGGEAGRLVRLPVALTGLAIEMMAHRRDLLAIAEDHNRSDPERNFYNRRALDLELYATAINVIALQLEPDRWQQGDYSGLLELARLNSITLPDWMTKDE